jgi:hypothetical protein
MRESRFSNSTDAPVGSPRSDVMAVAWPPTDDDAGLLTLEVQFNGIVAELVAAQKASSELVICPDQLSLVHDNARSGADAELDHEDTTKQVEALLARLCPIEEAIMATPARTIAGLGVKARHAAYVMSEYWNGPSDRIDWDARAMKLLIEAVCKVAQVPLPFRGASEVER